MIVRFYWERLKSPLPNMTAPLVVPVIPADVTRHQPLHPATQVAVLERPKHQVKMVCQQAISHETHRQPLVRFSHQIYERQIVFGFVKNIPSPISAIEDMVNIAALGCS